MLNVAVVAAVGWWRKWWQLLVSGLFERWRILAHVWVWKVVPTNLQPVELVCCVRPKRKVVELNKLEAETDVAVAAVVGINVVVVVVAGDTAADSRPPGLWVLDIFVVADICHAVRCTSAFAVGPVWDIV